MNPSTHDISFVGQHVPDIKSITERLQAAIDETWENRGRSQYSQVHVLLLSWKDDDLNVFTELDELQAIFTKCYHYSVESWGIPSEKPAMNLHGRITDFLKKEGPEVLLIVYYAGHAIQHEQRSEPPIWTSRRRNPARLPSSILQSVLAECDSDVLLLYDCCYAVPTTTGVTGRGVMEVLAACGFEGIAAEVGPHSFTHSLIQELGKACWGNPISIAELYARLIERLRTWTPCIARDPSGEMKLNSEGKPLFERAVRKTPFHCTLSNEVKRRSILLSPLSLESTTQSSSVASPLAINPVAGSSTNLDSKQEKTKIRTEGDDFRTHQSAEYPQVILSIRVSTEQFDMNTWLEWIRDVPPEATKIKVEGIYSSLSTLILLKMPITTWDLLPDNPAYSFVGFVTSENLVPTFTKLETKKLSPKRKKLSPKRKELSRKRKKLSRKSGDESMNSSSTLSELQDAPEARLIKDGVDNILGQPALAAHNASPLPVTTQRSSATLISRGRSRTTLWVCCKCGESEMRTIVDACLSFNCGHIRCALCETYRSNK